MENRLIRVVQNYEVKLRLSAAGKLSEREIKQRVTHYGIFAAYDDSLLNQVRQVLCGHGIVPMMFPAYHAFSRELGKLTRQVLSPESMQSEYAIIMSKWVARGLVQAVLQDIGCNLFNLQLPASPSE